MKRYDPTTMASQFQQRLSQREQALCAILNARDEAISDETADFKDLAAGDSAAAVTDAQAEQAAFELEQVLAAQRRMQDGTFGDCTGCGAPIDLRRLLALPEAALCTACQKAQESRDAACH